jgi:hypothetical protein
MYPMHRFEPENVTELDCPHELEAGAAMRARIAQSDLAQAGPGRHRDVAFRRRPLPDDLRTALTKINKIRPGAH